MTQALTSFNIDWLSQQSHILSSEGKLKEYQKNDVFLEPGLIWLKTSGTTTTDSSEKWIGIQKQAILASAKSVNNYINVSSNDIWLNTLPLYHIGGLSIEARSFLSGSKTIHCPITPWNTKVFYQNILSSNASLISLVPTQVYDLVKDQVTCPDTIRAVFVGGGYLSSELYLKGRGLGWPLLTTYGMTEMSSQVATAELATLDEINYPKLKLLPHIKAKLSPENLLMLSSPSMYKYKVKVKNEQVEVERAKEFITTEDQVELNDKYLNFIQRKSDRIKVAGYLVDKLQLNKQLTKLIEQNGMDSRCFTIQNIKNLRRENDLILFFENYRFDEIQDIIQQFNKPLKPAEQIRRLYRVNKLERTELGKLKSQLEIFRL